MKQKQRDHRSERIWCFLFLLPSIILFLAFQLYPIIKSLYYGFTNANGIAKPEFVGLQNYIKVFRNQEFWISLRHTIHFTIGTTVGGVALALIVAVLLNKKLRGQSIFRAAFFVPYVISYVVAAMVWQWMYQPDYGLINSFLGLLHIPQPPWLASTSWSLPAVVIMTVWKTMGYNIVLLLAGLQSLSPAVLEAARIDGAGRSQTFFRVTVPMMRNTLIFVILISLINGLQAFDQIYIMTGGGPLKSTQTVVYLIYQNAFSYYKQGYSSAMSYVLFVIIFAISMVLFRVTGFGREDD